MQPYAQQQTHGPNPPDETPTERLHRRCKEIQDKARTELDNEIEMWRAAESDRVRTEAIEESEKR